MIHGSRLCTFYVDQLWAGIAVERVQEVVPSLALTHVPLAPPAVAGLFSLRGQIATAIDLRRRLALRESPAADATSMLVVLSNNAALGLIVDGIGEVVEAPYEALETALVSLPAHCRGLVPYVCKFPGRLLHVLDLDMILDDDNLSQSGKP